MTSQNEKPASKWQQKTQ